VFGTTFPVGVGTHTLMYTAFDNAGNESNPKTLTFTVLPNGYKPFLGKVGVKAGKNHRMTFRGTVTAAPTAKNVTLTIQRKVKNKWKAFRTLNVNVPAYVGSYSITNYIAPHASFRVMASQGTGASGWTNFAVH
jgi:hypothetical protein